jgi:cytochrome P450
MFTGFYHQTIHPLHEGYGPVVMVGPNALSYINSQAWKDFYAHKAHGQEMIKDPECYVKHPDAHTIVNGNHEEHARHRRLESPGFSARSLREQEPLIQNYVYMFIRGIGRLCENGETPTV